MSYGHLLEIIGAIRARAKIDQIILIWIWSNITVRTSNLNETILIERETCIWSRIKVSINLNWKKKELSYTFRKWNCCADHDLVKLVARCSSSVMVLPPLDTDDIHLVLVWKLLLVFYYGIAPLLDYTFFSFENVMMMTMSSDVGKQSKYGTKHCINERNFYFLINKWENLYTYYFSIWMKT